MKRLVLAVVAAGLLIAASASGVVAKTTKIEVTGTAIIYQMIPGTETWVGTVQSMRGMILAENGVWSSPYLTGPQLGTVNFDLDYATGNGAMWGSEHHTVTAVPGGGWDCQFQATILDFVATGKGVCHGTGTLHTWQWRADVHMIWGSPVTEFTGYFFEPGH